MFTSYSSGGRYNIAPGFEKLYQVVVRHDMSAQGALLTTRYSDLPTVDCIVTSR